MLGSISEFHAARGARARVCALAVLGATGVAFAGPEEDVAELPGATLRVARSRDAESCADARALSGRLIPLLEQDSRSTPLAIDVALEHAGDEWVADVVVRGSAEGMRRLRAPGPGCGELERRLTALLVIVLDRPVADAEPPLPGPESEANAAAPVPKPAAPAPTPVPSPPRESPPAVLRAEPAADSRTVRRQANASTPITSGFVNGGAGLTAGVAGRPLAWIFASFGVEQSPWQVSLTGFTSFDSTEPLAPGAVDVRWSGGLVRPCVQALEGGPVRAFGCGVLMVAALRGEAHGYQVVDGSAYRPYYAAGAGALGVLPLGSSLRLSLEASVLAPLVRESFSIRGSGVAFETPRAGGWFGVSIGTQIW
jgi:hypothetical protein